MRTKALLCAAALAAGAATSMAQNVYSLNVVGYINLTLPAGFSLVANQLDVDGTGTNNTTTGIFGSQLPAGSGVFLWNGTGYNVATYVKNKAGTATNWDNNFAMNPGMGAWVKIPTGATTVTATTVGNVLQGTLPNPNLPAAGGYALLSSIAPVAAGMVTTLGYVPRAGDGVFQWNGTGYNVTTYVKNKAGTATNWDNGEPALLVGQGFWLHTTAGQTWTESFTVN